MIPTRGRNRFLSFDWGSQSIAQSNFQRSSLLGKDEKPINCCGHRQEIFRRIRKIFFGPEIERNLIYLPRLHLGVLSTAASPAKGGETVQITKAPASTFFIFFGKRFSGYDDACVTVVRIRIRHAAADDYGWGYGPLPRRDQGAAFERYSKEATQSGPVGRKESPPTKDRSRVDPAGGRRFLEGRPRR